MKEIKLGESTWVIASDDCSEMEAILEEVKCTNELLKKVRLCDEAYPKSFTKKEQQDIEAMIEAIVRKEK